MLDARTISTDELRHRLDHGHIPHLWNVLTSPYFTGELIPGSTRMPPDTIGHATTSVPKDAEVINVLRWTKVPTEWASRSTSTRARVQERARLRGRPRGLEGGGTFRRNASRAGTGGMTPRGRRFASACDPPVCRACHRGRLEPSERNSRSMRRR